LVRYHFGNFKQHIKSEMNGIHSTNGRLLGYGGWRSLSKIEY